MPEDDGPGREAATEAEVPADTLVERGRSYARRRIEWARATAERDVDALSTLPGGPWHVFGLVGVMVGAFSLLRLGFETIYTESLAFLLLAVVVGLFGWTPGVLLVAHHAMVDLLRTAGGLTLGTFVGHLVSYVVLYALVVSIPATQRSLHARLDRADADYPWLDWAAPTVSALVAGGLVFLWSEAAPYLLRAAFERSPTVASIATIQRNDVLLVAWTVLVAFAVAVGYQRRVGIIVTLPWQNEPTLVPGQFLWLRRLLRYGVVVVLLSGLITSALDVVVLAAALVAADLVLPVAARIEPFQATLRGVPFTVRLLVAFGTVFVLSQGILTLRYGPFAGSQFFPLVLSLAVGLVVFRLLLNVDEAAEPDASSSSAPSRVGAVALVAVLAVLALATVPDVALAHDCSSLADCEDGARAGTAAGMTALVLALWYWTYGGSTPLGGGGSPPDGGTAGLGGDEPGVDVGGGEAVEAEADTKPSTRLAGAGGAGTATGEAGLNEADEPDDESDGSGELKVVEVVPADAPGAEYVVLRNVGDAALDVSEWTVAAAGPADEGPARYTVPRGVVLEPGTRVRLYTGPGPDTESRLHWGLAEPVWLSGGRVVVRNAVGDVVDTAEPAG